MKSLSVYSAFLFQLILTTCNSEYEKSNLVASSIPENQQNITSGANSDSEREYIDRLKLTGDFNGDKVVDTIYESYTSKLTGKETAKEFEAEDYEQEVEKIIQNQPVCKIISSIPNIPLFLVTEEPQQTGIAKFENLGDLNNDGGDEIGYVVKWADFSNINNYHIISLSGKGFKEIYSFPINETINYEDEYLFGINSLIQKIGPKKFKYKFYSEEAEVEEKEVNLE